MVSDIWLRTILIVRKETLCRHIGYSYRLAARVLLYAPSHRQDNTYHGLCYTSRGALAGTRNSSMKDPWRIDPTTHRTMSEHSTSELRPALPTGWVHCYILYYVALCCAILYVMIYNTHVKLFRTMTLLNYQYIFYQHNHSIPKWVINNHLS